MKPNRLIFLSAIASFVIALGSASADPVVYVADLNGATEGTPSNGTGFAQVTLDLTMHTLQVDFSFSGLTGTTTAAHIHAPTSAPFTGTAGVATQTPYFIGFPTGVTSGSYSHIFDTLDAATYNSAYVSANGGTAAGAETALAQALADGKAYLNIHTSEFPGGEIRGFLAVPEPTTLILLAVGAVGLLVRRRMR